MVLRVVLLCLLSLCLSGTEAQLVDQNNLVRIIDEIVNRYNPGHGDQFAVAINVPDHYCVKTDSKPDKNFLKNDDPDKAKKDMNGADGVYVGTSVIGATKKKVGNTIYHSEYLLLNQKRENETPMQTLLKRNQKGCVIFYTYYSPCLGTCLNRAKGKLNIFTALKNFGKHEGPKAFVFRKLYGEEKKKEFEKAFKDVNSDVPLYHCEHCVCNSCVTDGQVKAECLPQRS